MSAGNNLPKRRLTQASLRCSRWVSLCSLPLKGCWINYLQRSRQFQSPRGDPGEHSRDSECVSDGLGKTSAPESGFFGWRARGRPLELSGSVRSGAVGLHHGAGDAASAGNATWLRMCDYPTRLKPSQGLKLSPAAGGRASTMLKLKVSH